MAKTVTAKTQMTGTRTALRRGRRIAARSVNAVRGLKRARRWNQRSCIGARRLAPPNTKPIPSHGFCPSILRRSEPPLSLIKNPTTDPRVPAAITAIQAKGEGGVRTPAVGIDQPDQGRADPPRLRRSEARAESPDRLPTGLQCPDDGRRKAQDPGQEAGGAPAALGPEVLSEEGDHRPAQNQEHEPVSEIECGGRRREAEMRSAGPSSFRHEESEGWDAGSAGGSSPRRPDGWPSLCSSCSSLTWHRASTGN